MSKRIERVNSLIKKELGQIILREVDFPEGTMVTLTRVETTSNLIEAKVYISVLPEEKEKKALDILNKSIYDLQKLLDKKLRMRPVPKIRFVKETKTAEAAKIEGILEGLKNKGK